MHSYYGTTSVNGTMSQRLSTSLGVLEQMRVCRTWPHGRCRSPCLLSSGFANQLLVCQPCLEHLPLPHGGLSQLGDDAETVGTGQRINTVILFPRSSDDTT